MSKVKMSNDQLKKRKNRKIRGHKNPRRGFKIVVAIGETLNKSSYSPPGGLPAKGTKAGRQGFITNRYLLICNIYDVEKPCFANFCNYATSTMLEKLDLEIHHRE